MGIIYSRHRCEKVLSETETAVLYSIAKIRRRAVIQHLPCARGGEFKVRPKYYPIQILDSPPSTEKEGSGKGSESENFHWCDYPFSHLESARLKDEDLKEAFRNAKYLKLLLPPPIMNQIPPAPLCVHGEMLSSNRIQHTETTYMGTGEIEMILALLLNDGRYDDAVSVVPLSYVEAIRLAAKAHAEYEDAVVALDCLRKERLKLRSTVVESKFGKTTNHDPNFAGISDESHEKWNEYVEVCGFEYIFDEETDRLCTTKRSELKFEALEQNASQRMTIIIQKVLMPSPSLLDKKLLVVPQCAGKHWSAVFIFNTSCIELAQSGQCNVPGRMSATMPFPILLNSTRRNTTCTNIPRNTMVFEFGFKLRQAS